MCISVGLCLVDLRTSSNLMVAKLNRDELQLDIVGTVPAVQMAKCLWSTQLEYVDRQIEIEEDERQVREQLHAVRKQVGCSFFYFLFSFEIYLQYPVWISKFKGEKVCREYSHRE